MPDIATIFDGDLLQGDLALDGASLAEDAGLTTAVVLSLFSDSRALDIDELPPGETDRRGWWGDIVPPAGVEPGDDRFGSRLWLLAREKQTNETLNRARGYATEALQWLVEDGIAESVDVDSEWFATGVLALEIRINLKGGAITERHFKLPVGAS